MANDQSIHNDKELAEEIIARSPSIAVRFTRKHGSWDVAFITSNITVYGYTREDFLSEKVSWEELVHPDDREDLVNLLSGFAEMRNDQYNIVYRIMPREGKPVWVSDNRVVVRDADGQIMYCDSLITDYTETKQHIESIGEHYRQQSVMNTILQGLHNADLDQALQIILDNSGSYLDVSRVVLYKDEPGHASCVLMHEWRNRGIRSLIQQGPYRVNFGEHIPEIDDTLNRTGFHVINYGEIPPQAAARFAAEGVIASAIFAVTIDGERFGVLCFDECSKHRQWSRETVRFMENVASLVAPVIVRRRNEMIIQSLALTDQLTGLNNRHHLEKALNTAINDARQRGLWGYILFIDMDDFKVINDAYGHDYGDAFLKEVSSFLVDHFKGGRNIFRFGGDEFVIVVEPEKAEKIHGIIEGLLARAQTPWRVIDRNFYCTLSIGVVRFPEGDEDSREIIKNADIAMYQAKKMGKNNYVFYSGALDQDYLARAEMERAMREAIDQGFNGFDVVYQPLTALDERILGAEALVRWDLPDGRKLAPMKFIPLAEYLGLVVPIGEFVLRSSARLCREINRRRPDFFVSVNVSIRQFKQSDFIERILRILDSEGVWHHNIILEITEGMAIHDMQRMRYLAGELNRRGIRLAMDDFGTGYSSLGNLRDLPIDVVKIDKSFIHDVTSDPYSKSFIRFVTDLVHSMGRKVCVEGVETAGQFQYCRECAVDYVQGFHMWRPMQEENLLELLQESENRDSVTTIRNRRTETTARRGPPGGVDPTK